MNLVSWIILLILLSLIGWFIALNVKWHRAGERCGCLGNCKKCEYHCQINPKYWGTKPPAHHEFLTGMRGPHGERL